jgi:hypothetical protein
MVPAPAHLRVTDIVEIVLVLDHLTTIVDVTVAHARDRLVTTTTTIIILDQGRLAVVDTATRRQESLFGR